MRKILGALALAVGASLVIGGCGGASSGSGSSGPVTLTFWGTYGNGGNKAETDALNNTIIPAFEKKDRKSVV